MVDAIIGKWKSDSSKPEGYDEYRAASASADPLPPEPEELVLELTKNGEVWSFKSEKAGKPYYAVTTKDGEEQVIKAPGGSEVKIQGRIDGNKWRYVMTVKDTDFRTTLYVDGNDLVLEQKIKTATIKRRLQKIQ